MSARNWEAAKRRYGQAIQLMRAAQQQVELANMELNRRTAPHLSGGGVDRTEVERLTSFLEAEGDPRAAKGRAILEDL